MGKAKRTRLTTEQTIVVNDLLRSNKEIYEGMSAKDAATVMMGELSFTVPASTVERLAIKEGIQLGHGGNGKERKRRGWKQGYKIGEVKVEKALVREISPEALEVKVRLSIIVEKGV